MKKLIILLAAVLALALCSAAGADPAKTDGTVTAWIGEENALFLRCSDGVTRKLSVPMKDILKMTDTDVVGLTQASQIVAVKKDGTGYSILSAYATDEEAAAQKDTSFLLADGKLTVGDSVYSERAVAAATDGLVLYWVNKGDNGYRPGAGGADRHERSGTDLSLRDRGGADADRGRPEHCFHQPENRRIQAFYRLRTDDDRRLHGG